MSANDTVGMQAGILVIGYDPRTASCTVQILSTSDGFEVVGDGSAATSGHGEALAEAEPAGELPPLSALICAASVQHNFRAGRHPGRCKPGSAAAGDHRYRLAHGDQDRRPGGPADRVLHEP